MPNHNTLLISLDYLRDNTSISSEVDSNVLIPHIQTAQNLRIEQLLGTALYDEVIAAVDAGTVSGNIKTLLDNYIQPCLKEWAFYQALPFIKYSISNVGVTTRDSENDSEASLEELQFLRGAVRDTAEYMSQKVINYLKANVDLYSSYQNPGSEIDDIRPNSSVYFSGIAFDGNDYDDCNWGEGSVNIPLN